MIPSITMLGRIARAAVIFGFSMTWACYTPPEPACGFVCGQEHQCPEDYSCSAADNVCHRNGTPDSLVCEHVTPPFDVESVTSSGTHSVVVSFSAAPDPVSAAVASNYAISGLTILGSPVLADRAVTLTTAPQAAMTYTLVVSGVTRAVDGAPLMMSGGAFTGTPPFEVTSATSVATHAVTVSFSAPPKFAQAVDMANYAIPGLILTGTPSLTGSTVTLSTSSQIAQPYTVTVTNVTRATDSEPLDTATAMFTGRTPFNVTSAVASTTTSIIVTFDAPPNLTQATTLTNYTVSGLALSGTPVLNGSAVTITTAAQVAMPYMLNVTNVKRASDAEPLSNASAAFTGVSCIDGMQDGDETDTDCGGPACTPCGDGKMCLINSDCASNNCAGTTCAP